MVSRGVSVTEPVSVCAGAGVPLSFRVVRLASLALAISATCVASSAAAGTGRLVRTSLDEPGAEVAPPHGARIIRRTLDDASHREFPLDSTGERRIRVSLDETNAYAPLQPAARRERQLRTSLD